MISIIRPRRTWLQASKMSKQQLLCTNSCSAFFQTKKKLQNEMRNSKIYIYIYISPGPGYLRSKDGVVRLWQSLINLYIWLTISSCSGSIHLTLGLIGRDGGLSTLRYSCGFACQQRVLKTFPGPGYLRSKNGVV